MAVSRRRDSADSVDDTDPPATTPQPARWRYTGDIPRVYTTIPVTVTNGDVVEWPTPPADDGNWRPDPGPATRHHDNHRTEER